MMKSKKVEVEMVDGEGLVSLLGDRVLIMCATYFYEGILEGVNDECVLLTDVGIVYSIGDWSEKEWGNRQPLPGQHYVMKQSIESFCLSPSVVLT